MRDTVIYGFSQANNGMSNQNSLQRKESIIRIQAAIKTTIWTDAGARTHATHFSAPLLQCPLSAATTVTIIRPHDCLQSVTIAYNLSRRNVSSVAESVTRFGSVSIWRPSKSRGSRPSLSTSSEGKRSESKLSGIPTIALPMSLTKSWRDRVSSAPVTWTRRQLLPSLVRRVGAPGQIFEEYNKASWEVNNMFNETIKETATFIDSLAKGGLSIHKHCQHVHKRNN